MKGSFNTDYGNVAIDNSVIARIAGLAAIECFGIVGLAGMNKRDGVTKLLTRNSLTRGIKVNIEGNLISIDFHVIVSFGVSISTVAKNLVDTVKYQLEQTTGFKIHKINIYVEGVRVID